MPQTSMSPIALNSQMKAPSMFNKKKKSNGSLTIPSAASYLTAVHEMDTLARARSASPAVDIGRRSATPSSTPALSFSSTTTTPSDLSPLDYINKNDFYYDDYYDDDNVDGLSHPSIPPTSEQVFTTRHSEFGHCANEQYRHISRYSSGHPVKGKHEQDPPYYILLSTYMSYLILILLGHMRDFIGKRFMPSSFKHLMPQNGYAPLNSDFDSFYTRRLKLRIEECFARPVTGVPGRTITLLDRVTEDYGGSFKFTGTRTRALNVSSYNYLGFAQARGGCADSVEEGIKRYGISACGARLEAGSLDLHTQAEALVARFVGQEDALISSMGFATNSTFIPALVGKGCLIISDELNHASIRYGVRLSGASVRMFKHNNMNSLETLLREVISQGQPRTHRPWKKILLIVEGLYSMEGTLVDLPSIMELKKKYKFCLFIDEAHSIGALGPHGRGVADYFGINPRSIDILMGTFTKSFGAAGGYVSGNKVLIDHLRVRGHSGAYCEAMSPPVLTQLMASMASIMGIAPPITASTSSSSTLSPSTSSLLSPSSSTSTVTIAADPTAHLGAAPSSLVPSWFPLSQSTKDGTEGRHRLRRLAFNARYLSRALRKLGFIVYGHSDSPIIPLLLFNPAKMLVFSRMMVERRTPIVVVVVAYPATPLVTSRARFCLSAAHTKEDVDILLRACDEIGTILDLKHGRPEGAERWTIDQVIERAVELVESD